MVLTPCIIKYLLLNSVKRSKVRYMTTPEKKVKERVKKVLDKLNAYYFLPSQMYGRKGIPDIIVCYQGKFFGIECKANNNKPTKLQIHELNKIQKAGGCTIVFTDKTTTEELESFLRGDNKDGSHWALQNIS